MESGKKRICVILRGQLREWEHCKTSIFAALSRIECECEVSYLLTFWKDPKTISRNFTEDFIGRQLIGVELIDLDEAKRKHIGDFLLPLSFELASFIRHSANQAKQRYERAVGKKFDTVIELRPDMFLLPQQHEESIQHAISGQLPEKTLYVPGGKSFRQVRVSAGQPSLLPFTDDNIIISDSESNDLVNSQFCFYRDHKNDRKFSRLYPHFLMALHTERVGLSVINNVHWYFGGYAIVRDPANFVNEIDFADISEETLQKIEEENQRFLSRRK